MADLEALKKEAALRAVALVESGMCVGLGTGSTAKYAIEELGRKISSGELTGIIGVATSNASEQLAREVGVPVEEFDCQQFDVAIDGADEIAPNLDLIKGLGGALTREKLLELRAHRLVIIADHTKLVKRIGEKAPIPVEIVRFGVASTLERLRDLGAGGELRSRGGEHFVTDNGNLIFDARFARIDDASALARDLKLTAGVVETGLFLGMAERAFVATPEGVRELTRA
ncbi:ribose 5-phosphate isomerase A [Deinococcus peraridilitoris]|uniref:Ribose-5-phosphate isomerase A n=1 Tax=Deinococcus peraridilitoris (strain DSM 19664 / LMG 22246 / CIP 109416 / KR-200) TaxID=937777 RepID=K9ZYM6_DEIPD|nr:ribose 5-phosphate isomerase A [Deinococcus peraridilitoris]AFZ65860.1 ribose 5-phosphate isomerase [Deinococcus peraridilitoris DSM 19664]